MSVFNEVKKNFGFGCMRLPMKDNEVDIEQFSVMVDSFLNAGFNYFDTAHGYLSEKSEPAIREALVKRHDRASFILTDKLSSPYFKTHEEIRPLFESQLAACGVDYFDFYLMHSQNRNSFKKFKECKAYETAFELKKEGKVRHVGISFHDTADVLDQILTEYPELECVQIQFNYIDYDDDGVQSKLCYDVCRKHNKPIIIMEPVKGGSLAGLPAEAEALLSPFGGSSASFAIRYAASFEGVFMVLSGMSNTEQMNDNLSFMRDFKPLSDDEFKAIDRVREVLKSMDIIQCTGCSYCTDGCPSNIPIPTIFKIVNNSKRYTNYGAKWWYGFQTGGTRGKASDCVQCGQCEDICPQKLNVIELLKQAAAELE
ncbi:MAG: aldo/keto reductase [Clostridia bacterium]|nr:aldo/keto reductase [Clostridia bacterium]